MITPSIVEGLSPLEAYHKDLAAEGHSSAPCLAAAVRLWQGNSRRAPQSLLREAADKAAEQLGEKILRRGCSYDARPATSSIAILRLAAQETELAGYLHLSGVMLDTVAAACRPKSTAEIQVLADRARNARKRGRYDLAEGRALRVLSTAKIGTNDNLLARGYLELAGLAQARGNYPEAGTHARSALRHGLRARNRRIVGAAHSALGIRRALAGELDEAVKHFGAAYDLAKPNEAQFFEAVANLAQVALDSGYPLFALRIARHGLGRPLPMQSAFALLGTAAKASAAENNVESTMWATEEIRRLSTSDRHPREAAMALAESWEAHSKLGRLRTASSFRNAALRLGTAYGLGEVLHRLDRRAPRVEPKRALELRASRVSILSAVGDESSEPIRVAIGS